MASIVKGTILLNSETDSSTKREFYPKTTVDQIEGLTVKNGKIENVNSASVATYAEYDKDEINKAIPVRISDKYAKATDVRNSVITNIEIVNNKIALKNFNGTTISESNQIPINSTLVAGPINSTTNKTATNGNVHLNLINNDAIKGSINIKGSGSVSVTSTVVSNKASVIISAPNYGPANDTDLGLVKVKENSNINIGADGTLSLTAENIADALNYVPSSLNADNVSGVKQSASETNNTYPLLASNITTAKIQKNTVTSTIYDNDIKINPNTGVVYAKAFVGENFKGNY